MNQIALPFAWPVADRDEDFLLSDANRTAFEHLTRWSLWPVMATLVTGPRKSGRSLLGRIFVRKTGGRLFDNAEAHDEEDRGSALRAEALVLEREPVSRDRRHRGRDTDRGTASGASRRGGTGASARDAARGDRRARTTRPGSCRCRCGSR